MSVLDGAICSSGTSSPVAGSRYWTRLWWVSSRSSSHADAGGPQHLDDRPCPEGMVFLPGQVAALAVAESCGPGPARRACGRRSG